MRFGITGASGFLGQELIRQATVAGHQTIGFTRSRNRKVPGVTETQTFGPGMNVSGLKAVIHLAGESLFGLWTRSRRERIRRSRVEGTRWVVQAIERAVIRPAALISASGIGIYGDRGDDFLTDDAPASRYGFLADVSRAWEAEAVEARGLGVQVAPVRLGVVLGRRGALPLMATTFRTGLGGKLGSGKQWMPWIHIYDAAALFLFLAEQGSVNAPVNGVAPEIVRNEEFTRKLARTLWRPAIVPMPAFALKGVLPEESTLLLNSARAVPERALSAGFRFKFPELEPALRDLLR